MAKGVNDAKEQHMLLFHFSSCDREETPILPSSGDLGRNFVMNCIIDINPSAAFRLDSEFN